MRAGGPPRMAPTDPPPPISLEDAVIELGRCRQSLAHFCNEYGRVKEGVGHVRPFQLWPSQLPVCEAIDTCRFVVALKARQLGLTWISAHDALRTMVLFP